MQRLEIETPEHVVLDLEVAGVGSRALAALIDSAILFGGAAALFLLIVVLGVVAYRYRVKILAKVLGQPERRIERQMGRKKLH